ncbi:MULTISPECIES: Bug family tripartite tricarboxylate transporter substrate binding protein [unclassified Variovorax]|uniref:Bug family tripartite tricarboxylate transporter substrate binding protein n=1 Tax=unclassified Variovorax TaxID=663243 RepID=UPI003ECFC4AB
MKIQCHAIVPRLFRLTGAIVRTLAMACAAALVAGGAHAQQFPSRPIKILIGYGAGGGTDSLARLYAAKLQEVLNTPVVIDNKPGASELLAAQPVMNAAPDGYTLWIGTGGALAQNPGVRRDLPYDVLKNFTPIALLAEAEAVLILKPGVPVSSLPELVDYGKANPGKLNYGSGGIGSGNHLQMEYLISVTGASFTHIPYKSEAEITRDAMAGNVDLSMITAQFAVPLVNEGKVKAIAVTGAQRLKSLPNVPSVAEAGGSALKSMGSYTFFGLMGPARMPAPIVQRLNEAFNKVSAMPEVDQRMREVMFLRPKVAPPEEYRQYLERELAKWRELSKTVKIGTS